ncbi:MULTISPECIES: DUF3800 domain-containing protein [Rhizobium]|uniref:DUF3800 domain-containing protein n=1 Tax=Rhizobium TaxID=379 RepID=UPI001FCC7D02|nr:MULTISPECIES: DUF3800 domain-containing protein [Rhizobium]
MASESTVSTGRLRTLLGYPKRGVNARQLGIANNFHGPRFAGAIFVGGYSLSNALVLLDESGDLGWQLNLPYRQGGSSRYFTVGAIVGINDNHRVPGKVVKALKKEFDWTSNNEKKWIGIGSGVRRSFAHRAVKMVKENPRVHLLVAVIDKQKVPKHIQGHFHLFYSWMASSLIGPTVRHLRQVSICPDELNAGLGYDVLIESILRKDLWFHMRSQTEVSRIIRSKPLEDGLAFCDYLAGTFQSHFEDGDSEAYNILKDHVYLHMPWS